MPILGIVIGAMLAATTLGVSNLLWGAILGFFAGTVLDLKQELKALDEYVRSEVAQLRSRVRELEQGAKRGLTETETPTAKPAALAAVSAEERLQRRNAERPAPESREVLPPEEPKKQKVQATQVPEISPYIAWIVDYFSKGNAIAKVGVVLLFFGVSFLVKYVGDQGYFPIELRLIAVAAGAMGLLALGWRLRERKGPFALLLQGGGIGVFYLTVFASFRLYDLLPASLAFVLLLAAVILSSCLAALQDSRTLAVFSVAGGFLAPVLASTGKGSHVMLFSYYAVLNLGILGLSWFRSWRELNLVGFLFTFVISGSWGLQYYQPEFFASTEPFLILFFLLYLAVTLLFAVGKKAPQALLVDGTLVFGVPVAAFALQAGLVKNMEQGLAWSAVALGAFYLAAARILFAGQRERARLMVEAFFAIGGCFLTLAIPLAVDGQWTAAIWGLEGAAILWSGVRQNRPLARYSGMLLQILAGCAYFLAEKRPPDSFPVFNAYFLGTAILTLSNLAVGFFLRQADGSQVKSEEKAITPLFLVMGLMWWVIGGTVELNHAVPTWYRLVTGDPWVGGAAAVPVLIHSFVLFLALSTLLIHALSRKLKWELMGAVRLGLMPFLALLTVLYYWSCPHPFANIGSLAWIAAFVTHYRVLRASETGFSAIQHFAALWLLTVLGSWEAYWIAERYISPQSIWGSVALAVVPGLMALGVVRSREGSPWPLGPLRKHYLGAGTAPLVAWLALWMVYLNFADPGDPRVLPYVPFANPLDLGQAFALLVMGSWFLEAGRTGFSWFPSIQDRVAVMGVSAFIWLSAGLARTIHHWFGLPWNLSELSSSNLVQAAFSIFWSAISLGLMILATRRKWRVLWITGAFLLGVVVLKLFLFDLSGRGTIERVISFIGTGGLLLLIGYLAPIPPETKASKDTVMEAK